MIILNREDRRAIRKRFKLWVDYSGFTLGDDSLLHKAAEKKDELAMRCLAVRTAHRLNPEVRQEHKVSALARLLQSYVTRPSILKELCHDPK